MILIDASIWIDHVRAPDDILLALLDNRSVLTHPFVIGEVALGHVRQREQLLDTLIDLPRARVAGEDEVLEFIRRHALAGMGIGYIDAHLLASAKLTAGSSVWTRDRHFRAVAERLGLSAGVA
jgi:hypothetical protein